MKIAQISPGSLNGEAGYWIRNGCVEAFLTAQSRIRITAFQQMGGQNLFSLSGRVTDGLRTWIMTPFDNELERDAVASLPGSIEITEDGTLRVTTGIASTPSLSLAWSVSLTPDRAELILEHSISNHGPTPLEMAIWPVIGTASNTRLILPLQPAGNRDKDPRAIYHFPWSKFQDERLFANADYLQLNVCPDSGADHLKFGVFHHSGSAALINGNKVLVSHTEVEPKSTYPEGGPNLTAYVSPPDTGYPFGELENVGALTRLQPEGRMTLAQRLSIEEVHNSSFLESIHYPQAK